MYKGTEDDAERKDLADELMKRFVMPGADEEVNLPSNIRVRDRTPSGAAAATPSRPLSSAEPARPLAQFPPPRHRRPPARSSHSPAARSAAALPLRSQSKITAAHKAAGDAAPPQDAFSEGEVEIFKLMERDAYARFKNDPNALRDVCDEFFASADREHDGVVTFAEYKEWVLKHPQVLVFFSQLSKSIKTLLYEARDGSSSPNSFIKQKKKGDAEVRFAPDVNSPSPTNDSAVLVTVPPN